MMCIKSFLQASPIHGLGVFAGEPVKKGTVIWKFNPLIDKVLTAKDIKSLQPLNREFVIHYSYMTDGLYVLGGDNGMYMNHSDNPNTEGLESEDGFGITVALRDIKKGEEITGNYEEFDAALDIKRSENTFV